MCFGSKVKSAKEIYEEEKPKEKPLLPLTMKPVERSEQKLSDVPRKTLLGGY